MEPSFPNIEVAKRSLHPSDSPLANWEGLRPGTTTLEPKHVNQPGRRAFDVATVFDRDVIIPLRDGHTLRADVFRPAESARVPALVAWSPYGKSGSGA